MVPYPCRSKKLSSAFKYHDELLEKVHKEIQSGRIIGPFKNLPLSNLHLYPVGLVPKSDGGC